ncbi:helix-turn-helix transcriptional regulator [Streptomyces sp. NBC_00094]|uniref:helix-turn-helix domain-containing protein n=1 Tax=Streptomyces sp. NBC_00094 TaxID=2903620 RepID=UPI00225C1FD2|nr:helix-turn-helix transcriptional regulator [Streptomyces sp. NBC_00094]MCX5394685.1 helix-turn-helix domain-containing protein [Streptomyces sp. NBC_00094]
MTTGLSLEGTPTATAALGTLIRGHRLRIGLTQRELADLSTISVRAIRDLEKGKALRPRADTIRLIADGLRLGPRARTALEESVSRGHQGGAGRHLLPERCAPPVPLHPLIGREAEAAILAEELRSGAERLVTVVGLSGVGKTRLALETAARLHESGFPVLWYTAPGAVTDCLPAADEDPLADLVADCAAYLQGAAAYTDATHPHGAGASGPYAEAARTSGVGASPAYADAAYLQGAGPSAASGATDPYGPAHGHRPGGAAAASPSSPSSSGELPPVALAAALGDREALLVLDGVDTARLDFGRLTRLRRELPGLRLLLTADTPWNVPGERLFLLAPLDAPLPVGPTAPGADAPAVRFLLARLRRMRPELLGDEQTLAHTAWIAHRLDGHPLALAAAASWLSVCDLPTLRGIVETDPAAVLDHLADGHSGSRLRDRVARTVSALPPEQRNLLTALCAAQDTPAPDFGLDDVVRLTGRPLPDGGRMVRALLIGGVIRPSTDHGRSGFRVLCVVRAALAPADGTGAAAAEAPAAAAPAAAA